MADEPAAGGGAEARLFTTYTSTDHARVELSARLFALAGECHEALIPENAAGDGWPNAGIKVAQDIMSAARGIMDAAVVAAYESGLTWQQIGRAFTTGQGDDGITRQSAHTKYAAAVAQFHEQLAAAIDRAERGENPVDYSRGPWPKRICNTESYAPRLDQAATVDYPAVLGTPAKPGEFTATLSDPATACSAQIAGGVRGPDARPLGCRYTEQLDDPYGDDGMYGWLACTSHEGHLGDHHLAVRTEG
ncbi:MAG TPA: hypothetical protein VHY31_07470 [Streptosporangiaceae bacterium]|jgi:hypothetical protein|nr:hypothetical protein [Streptosporangiaceae bacterium]